MSLESKIKENVVKGLNFVFVPGSIIKCMIANRDNLCLSDNDPQYMAALGFEAARLLVYVAAIPYVLQNLG